MQKREQYWEKCSSNSRSCMQFQKVTDWNVKFSDLFHRKKLFLKQEKRGNYFQLWDYWPSNRLKKRRKVGSSQSFELDRNSYRFTNRPLLLLWYPPHLAFSLSSAGQAGPMKYSKARSTYRPFFSRRRVKFRPFLFLALFPPPYLAPHLSIEYQILCTSWEKKEFRPDTRQANWLLLSFLACNADEKKVNGFNPPNKHHQLFSPETAHEEHKISIESLPREIRNAPLKKCRNKLKNMTAEQRKLKALTLLYTQVTFESLPSPLIWPSNTAANIHSGFGLLTKYMIIRARTFYLPVCTKCEKVVPPNSTVKTISPFNHTNIAMWASKNHKPPLLVTLIEKSVF